MKKIMVVLACLWIPLNCLADIPSRIIKRYHEIVFLIKEDKTKELSKLIEYPLKRENPLPDISTPKKFISYYPIIFDRAFKKKLDSYDHSYIFERNGAFGLNGGPFHGDIWISADGKITAINYSSSEELKLQEQLTNKIQNRVHSSVGAWKENVLVGKSEKLLIRIDRTDRGLRYVSWSKGRQMSEKPDLILYNGAEKAQGTMGGWTWTFKNGKWTYVIDDVAMCEDPKQCGFFLRLLFNGNLKSSTKLNQIK